MFLFALILVIERWRTMADLFMPFSLYYSGVKSDYGLVLEVLSPFSRPVETLDGDQS